jgi:electron transfer flavoprotein beta subunit
MELSVCIASVPDTASRLEIREDGIDLSMANFVMNPYDEYAVEEALRTRERFAGSTVTVFALGGAACREALRKALAMGADKAVLAVPSEDVRDSRQIAGLLSQALRCYYRNSLPELVFCGKESTDFHSSLVPVMLGGMLGMAVVTAISGIETGTGMLKADREIEGGKERVTAFFPAVVSTEKGLNTPRKASIKGVLAAKKAVIEELRIPVTVQPALLMSDYAPASRTRRCRFFDQPHELVRVLHEEAGGIG